MNKYEIEDKDYNFDEIKVGSIVTGRITHVEDKRITVDINSYVDATMYLNAYTSASLESFKGLVNVGDEIKGKVMKISGEYDDNQYVLISRLPLLQKENYEKLVEAYKNNESIKARVLKINSKGFVLLANGIEIFMPFGQYSLETETEEIRQNSIGTEIDVKITDLDEKRNRMIASRKIILKEQFNELKNKEYDSIKVGDVIVGDVVRLEPYGAFIKFNQNQALLRISQISHRKVENIREIIAIGEKIEVKVINKVDSKLEVSRKALLKTPFEEYMESHKKGEKVNGKVVQKLPFGILLEIGMDVVGLLHQSEYAWNPKDNFKDYIKIGDNLDVIIKGFDPKKESVSLSKKALDDNPWSRVDVKKGDTVNAEITNIIPGKGVDVVTCGIEAFIPVNDLSIEKISKIDDMFSVGDKLDAIVLDINKDEWYIKLSAKRFEEIKEKKQFEEYMNKEEQSVEGITLGDRFKELLEK